MVAAWSPEWHHTFAIIITDNTMLLCAQESQGDHADNNVHCNTLHDSTWQHTNNSSLKISVRIFLTPWSTSILFLDKNVTSKIICLNIMRVYFASGGFLSDKIIFQKEKVLLGQPSTSPELFSVRLIGLDTKIHKNDLSIYPEILQNSHFKWFFFNDIISIKYDIPLVELHGSTFKRIQNGHLTM